VKTYAVDVKTDRTPEEESAHRPNVPNGLIIIIVIIIVTIIIIMISED
jgi:Ca2+/H+ antiporter